MDWFEYAKVQARGWLTWGFGVTILIVSWYIHKIYRDRNGTRSIEGAIGGREKTQEPARQTKCMSRLDEKNCPKKVSCSGRNVLFFASGKRYELAKEDSVQTIEKLAAKSDLYLITEVCCDEQEEEIRKLLEKTSLYASGLDPIKVLFCSTPIGRAHMIKQLDVDLHIDSNYDVLDELCRPKRWVERLVHVGTKDEDSPPVDNLLSIEHVSDIFAK